MSPEGALNLYRRSWIKISAEGVGKAVAVQGDVTELEDLGKFITATVENFGRIDALVNNAGVFAMGSILDITPEQYDHIFDINVKAPLMLTKLVAQAMIEQEEGGSILNISSTVGSKPAAIYDSLCCVESSVK